MIGSDALAALVGDERVGDSGKVLGGLPDMVDEHSAFAEIEVFEFER